MGVPDVGKKFWYDFSEDQPAVIRREEAAREAIAGPATGEHEEGG